MKSGYLFPKTLNPEAIFLDCDAANFHKKYIKQK